MTSRFFVDWVHWTHTDGARMRVTTPRMSTPDACVNCGSTLRGRDYVLSVHATQPRFCTGLCREKWWSERRRLVADYKAEVLGGFFGLASFGWAVYFGNANRAGMGLSNAARAMMENPHDKAARLALAVAGMDLSAAWLAMSASEYQATVLKMLNQGGVN